MSDLQAYIEECYNCITQRDGNGLASLLRLNNPLSAKAATEYLSQKEDKFPPNSSNSSNPYKPVLEKRFLTSAAAGANRWKHAYSHFCDCMKAYQDILQEDKGQNWSLPVLYGMCTDLRLLAQEADNEHKAKGMKPENLSDAERLLKRGFQITMSDRSPLDVSKKWGTLEVINQLFKVYFKLNTLRLSKNLIMTFQQQSRIPFESYPISHRITFKYFTGRLNLYEDNTEEAEQDLNFAYNALRNTNYKRHRRQILNFLIPTRMLLRVLPREDIIQQYDLHHYSKLIRGFKTGNLKIFDDGCQENQNLFVHMGLICVLEKLRFIVLRTLFMRVHKMLDSTRIPLTILQKCLSISGSDVDLDEMECIVNNLINQGYIKGYVSHKQRILVVSKTAAFPSGKKLGV